MLNHDFNSIEEILTAFPDEQTCINHLEALRWNGFVVSPFDPSSKTYSCKKNKYRCKNSGKYFNVKTGTLFHDSKVALQKWFVAIWIVTVYKKGITSVALGKDLNITQKTAWYMIQRIKSYYTVEKEAIALEKKWPLSKNKLPETSSVKPTAVEAEKDRLQLVEWLQLLKK